MSQNSYLEIVLGCFASLDIDRLGFYLRDDYSYQDTAKEVFLNEIEKIFNEYKVSGDTELLIYGGICSGDGCTNCGCSGYRFIGNHSRNYLDLIFTINEDDITDIFYCTGFRTTEYHDELQNSISIDVDDDDLITFNKTPEYWAKVNSAKAAYEELVTTPARVLNYVEMHYWLDKYAFTAKNIQEDDSFSYRMKWSPFLRLYTQLSELKEYVSSHEEECIKANNSYKLAKEEKDLITWMLAHETMFSRVPFDFKYDVFEDGENYISEKIKSLVFSGSPFKDAFSFIANYHKHHFEVLNKYGIYNQDEIPEIIGHEEYDYATNPVYSLKFHLEKREEAAALGVSIPFNLNGYSAELDAKGKRD